MTNKKKLAKIAKKLYRESFEGNAISEKKITQIIKSLVKEKPQGLTTILKTYKRLIKNALAKKQIIVEAAEKMPNQKEFEKTILAKTHAQKVIFITNPKIVFGAKITHGDWIYDATLDAKLMQLTVNK